MCEKCGRCADLITPRDKSDESENSKNKFSREGLTEYF